MNAVDNDAVPTYPAVMTDYASFYDTDSGLIRLEVYWQLYNTALTFVPDAGHFSAGFDVTIRVRDQSGRQVKVYQRDKAIAVESAARAASERDFRTNQTGFLLPEGKYDVEFTLRDLNSERSYHRKFEVKLKDPLRKYPTLSDIELVNAAAQDDQSDGPFSKGNLAIIPSLTGEYGSSQNDRLRYYIEIYQGSESVDEVLVVSAIRRQWGGLAYRDSLTAELTEPVTRQLREITLDQLAPGAYELEISLVGRRQKKLSEKKATFFVEWSTEALVRDDYNAGLDLLSLIAKPGQLDGLDKLESHEERKAAVEAFWKSWDPTPGTPENEVRQEFFHRVKTANRSYAFMRTPGWRTDRGRVFIKHGEPDELDDFPMALDSYPYQEWHYHRSSTYLRFTFVDENGDGDYRLIYPYDGLNLVPDF
ncbi:MAG: GWxTD domain-containing protein [bacterium]